MSDLLTRYLRLGRLPASILKFSAVLLLIISVSNGYVVRAQPVLHLDDLPVDSPNTRFFVDQLLERRPALSFNGFTCGEACGDGLGLAEVLRAVYAEAEPTVVLVFERVLALAGEAVDANPASRGAVIRNTERLQALALVALAGYVLVRNGNALAQLNTKTQHPLLPPDEALSRLREGLTTPAVFSVDDALDVDAVKWTMALMNLARTLDLYLALENAYAYFDDPDYANPSATRLLSCDEKGQLLGDFARSAERLNALATAEILPGLGVGWDEVQPGNWPMKAHLAVGYAALTYQRPSGGLCADYSYLPLDDWLRRAFRSAGAPTEQDRARHWHYQTQSGRRFFAEGPYYFHLTLSEVAPFWHAIRLNGLLNFSPDYDGGDPFRAAWFLEPLHWLADLVTPDGRVPPLDDGNKARMGHTGVLRWSPAYGEGVLGRKFAWIHDRPLHGFGADDDLLPVVLAIPRLGRGQGQPPEAEVGNTLPEQTGSSGEQQLILRRTDARGRMHYVLLNGESGDALRRGEGHEQADQMQLLYFVDEVSALLDSGYDSAYGAENSTWNHYYDHNVMTLGRGGNGEGGVKAPRLRLDKLRIVSNHQDVQALYRERHGRLDLLHAQIFLDADDDLDGGAQPDYRRTVLLVDDAEAPYLIDVNAVAGPADTPFPYSMAYHGNADVLPRSPAQDGYALWAGLWATSEAPVRSDRHLFLQPFAVEYPLKASTGADRAGETYAGEREIVRLDIPAGAPSTDEATEHTTVAFIELRDGGPSLLAREGRTHESAGVADDVPLDWRFYTWQRDEQTLDVLAVRSAAVHRDPALRRGERLVVQAPGGAVPLHFPARNDLGFARLRYNDAAASWRVDPAFQFGLEKVQAVAAEGPVSREAFALLPNRPNPFAEETEIRFHLPTAAHVRLTLFDPTGREVATLLDEPREAGTHRLTWGARQHASGVYLCRLTVDGVSRTRRLVLAK